MNKFIFSLVIILNGIASITYSQEYVREGHGFSLNPSLVFNSRSDTTLFESPNNVNFRLSGFFFEKIFNKVELRYGLALKYVGYSLKDYSPRWPSDFINGKYVATNSWKEDNYKAINLGLPVQLLFPLLKKNRLYAHLGFEIEGALYSKYNSRHLVGGIESVSSEVEFNRRWRKLVRVGFGFQVVHSENYDISIEPTYERYLDKFSDSSLHNISTELLGISIVLLR